MAQTAMSRLFRQNTTSPVRQCILGQAQARRYASNSAIPSFTSTPSPELNEALDRFRNELFIPLGLPKRQRKSILRPKYAQQLQHDPITVQISETEEYTLTPKNRHELPSKREAISVLNIMIATKDFSNLFPFLSGLKLSNYVINNDRWEYIIRKVGEAGKLSAIIDCARQYKRTGLSLADTGIARRLFFELHQTAMRADFKGDETFKALKLAQDAATLMDSPEHSVRDAQVDPKYQPFVIGTLLELSAACALEKNGAEEVDAVRGYAEKLDAAWSRGDYKKADTSREAQLRLEENLAVYNGMRLSRAVYKDARMTQTFMARGEEMKPVLVAHLKNIKNSQVLGDKVSARLLSAAANKAAANKAAAKKAAEEKAAEEKVEA
ncbi:hypothetical protein N7461_001210 [Penicillium sp. DV-2018c]|nr:hypothetical protein N7461_001210 [Penicillium sp. DV-2018c]